MGDSAPFYDQTKLGQGRRTSGSQAMSIDWGGLRSRSKHSRIKSEEKGNLGKPTFWNGVALKETVDWRKNFKKCVDFSLVHTYFHF